MSFHKSKRSNLVVVTEGKEKMPLVDYSSSPPPMAEEEDACPLSNIAEPLPCEPNLEVNSDEYSGPDPHSNDTSSPEEDEPIPPIPVEQARAPDDEEHTALPSSYGDNHGEGLPSSYDDDLPQESRSRSPGPSTPRPRPRSHDEDTEMRLSSPTRKENPTGSSSQEGTSSSSNTSSPPDDGDNPTSVARLFRVIEFVHAEMEDDDTPVARSSQEWTGAGHERSSSPFGGVVFQSSQGSIEDLSHEQLSTMSSEEALDLQLSQGFFSRSYQEWASSDNEEEDTTPPSSNGRDTDDEMDPCTPMTSQAGSEFGDWDSENAGEDDDTAEEEEGSSS